MADVYRTIAIDTNRVNMQKLALIAACLAAAAHFWRGNTSGIFTDSRQATNCSQILMHLAEEAIQESRHDVKPTIESLQAVMILGNFLPPAKDLNRHTFLETILKSAKTMGIHQIDSRRNCERRIHSSYDILDLEMKRRVWWHIVYSDWMLSYM